MWSSALDPGRYMPSVGITPLMTCSLASVLSRIELSSILMAATPPARLSPLYTLVFEGMAPGVIAVALVSTFVRCLKPRKAFRFCVCVKCAVL